MEVILPVLVLSVGWAMSAFMAMNNMRHLRKAWAREAELHRLLDNQTARFQDQTTLLKTTTAKLNWALDQIESHRGAGTDQWTPTILN